MQYTNQEKIEANLKRSLTAIELENLDSMISMFSESISSICGRVWDSLDETGEIEETTRIYDGTGKGELFINDTDFTDISKIELLDSESGIFETITNADNMILYPLNSIHKNSIVLRNYSFPVGRARVKITGTFTSGDAPETIVMAVTKLCSDYFVSIDNTSNISQESIEGYSYKLKTPSEYSDEQKNILGTIGYYRKIRF